MGAARILIIEDNALDIILLRHAFDELGEAYDLEVLRDGESALQFVREHRSAVRAPDFCVILLDLYLPSHDGLAVLQAIREAPALEHIAVVILTSLASPRQEIEIASLGAQYRKKPSALPELIQLAAEIMEICRNAASGSSRPR